ncbi:TIGR01777 family oxidoreductase [Nocardioides marmoribigeumensis]|uniref:Uncharacterized protein (TIGR01777 family) n=1 Tax=Nocardioides marmoribigeumensis TaxID=433649 RepID=A0ABU2BPQ4_9ACTN|nr:TIGR01777 family oxidoreductase [Nocardioides marmoribigeumensis]MDR7360601.1 uncharacterized protein (TIGR01777 family) [Nocardioides marmoribigeumensis]
MRFLLAGASGFLGRAWASYLTSHDHEVVRLVRSEPSSAEEARWDPYAGTLDRGLVESADVVANLAGAPLAHWPWTESYKRTFLDSRVVTTRVLAEAVASSDRKPVLLAQNGVAGYGDRGAEVITEDTPFDGDTFIADVSRRWQAAADPAVEAGARVVVLRTGVVLDRSGGALKAMLPAFKAGVGGPIGNGKQYFATISLEDWLHAASSLAHDDSASGAYNLVGPDTSTNAEYTRELGRALHRPTFFRVPAAPLRAAGGVAGGELLSSARVEPRRLLDSGFAFAHADVADRVRAALEGFRAGRS